MSMSYPQTCVSIAAAILIIVCGALPVAGGSDGEEPQGIAAPARTLSEIVEEANQATVEIRCRRIDGERVLGTGFIVDQNGLVATNYHVVRDAAAVVVRLASGDEFSVVGVAGTDPRRDIAIVRVAGFKLPTVALGDSDDVLVGDDVVAIGNPLGLDHTVTKGILSAIRVVDGMKILQIDAAISPGNSGGPVLNRRGEVIGIATAKVAGGDQLNFAIPINYLRGLLGATRMLDLDALRSEVAEEEYVGRSESSPGGVLIVGYAPAGVFADVRLRILTFMADRGIAVGAKPASWGEMRDDTIALPFVLRQLKKDGKSELLYFSVSGGAGVLRGKVEIELRCYEPDGSLAWKEKVRGTGLLGWHSPTAVVEHALKKLDRVLQRRLGEACLRDRAAEAGDSGKGDQKEEARRGDRGSRED